MFGVRIYGPNADVTTLAYIQERFCQTSQARVSITTDQGRKKKNGRNGANTTFTREYAYDVRAQDVLALARPEGTGFAEAFVGCGRLWRSNGRPSLKVVFPRHQLSGAR